MTTPTPLLDVFTKDRTLPAGYDRWALQTVRPDFTTRQGFRWPWPGHLAVASDLYPNSPDPDRTRLTAALTAHGLGLSGPPSPGLLLLAYKTGAVLTRTDSTVDLREALVADLIDWHQAIRDGHLTGADLNRAPLAGADLHGAFLRDTTLKGATLTWANLANADLQDADLTRAEIAGANLYEVNLWHANLEYANLRDANLQGADLDDANLRYANLPDANLTHVRARRADLAYADLRGTIMTYADLDGANLQGADLTGASLARTPLDNTSLENATGLGRLLSTPPDLGPVAHFNPAPLTAHPTGAGL